MSRALTKRTRRTRRTMRNKKQKGGGKWTLLIDAIRDKFIGNHTLSNEAVKQIQKLQKGDFEGKKKVILDTFTRDTIKFNKDKFEQFITTLSKVTEADEMKRPTLIVDMAFGLRDPGMKNNPAY